MSTLPTTIEECHQVISLLLSNLNQLSKRIEALEIERQLKERLKNNSSNSSLPPSKSLKKKKNNRQSSGKRSGGQPGHKGHYRQLLASEQVDVIEQCGLPRSCLCGGKIKTSNDYMRHQVYELPLLKLKVILPRFHRHTYTTEYQLQKGCCADCHRHHIGSLPQGVTWSITGPRLTGFMSDLVTRYGLSRREQKSFLAEHFQFHISLGTVFNKQKITNLAMECPVAELLPIVKEASSVHADETGHNRDGKNQWTWGFISNTAAFFSIQGSRGKKVLRSLMGNFTNILVSDRYAAYNLFDSSQRQLCWAHLKRDFTKLSEKDDKLIARIGKNWLACESDLFKCWHEFKSGKVSRNELLRQARPIQKRTGELLEQGSYTDPALKAVRFCKNLLENFNVLWTFLECPDVEPTNNHAERSLRFFVIWRKKYFCTRSDYGTEYVARSASIQVTCKLQKKNYFDFLCTLLQNHFSGASTSMFSLIG